MPEHPDRRVDHLRERLKALGYLEGRVDRFVLGRSAWLRRPLALAVAASVRLGLLAGVLLGPAAAIGLRARLPALVTGGADAAVLAGYLTILFVLVTTVMAALAILIGGMVVRAGGIRPDRPNRARRAATTAGAIVTLTCLTYLTLWWRVAVPADATTIVWNAVAVLIALAISLLLGHGVTLTILALVARLGYPLQRGVPLSSWRAIAPLGGAAFVGAIALLLAAAPGRASDLDAPSVTVVPTGQRVLVVAIDGVDTTLLDWLQQEKRLPLFDRVSSQAVASLPADRDRDPAQVWTTIATGQPAGRHGVRGIESRQVTGLGGRLPSDFPGRSAITAATDVLRLTRPAIVSREERLIPAFWEVAARAGLRTAVIHWWATWPAPADLGIVLSDRAILRLEHGGQLDGEIAPASLYDELRSTWSERRRQAAAVAASVAGSGFAPDVAAVLKRSAELDATLIDLAADGRLGAPDLLVVYLPGLDIAQHALFSGENHPTLSPSAAAARVASLEAYYGFLDQRLRRLVDDQKIANRVVTFIMQPGRVSQPGAGRLTMIGSVARTTRASLAPTAIAPTVLHALGIPIARDLASQPGVELFAPAFLAAHPVRDVTTYGSRRPAARANRGQPLDREMIERMRSLGYVR